MTLSKSAFRQNCLKQIKSLPKATKLYRTKLINTKLQRELKGVKNKKILFYIPLSFEANILDTLKTLRVKNELFIPFMQGESFKMVPFRLPLKKKKFNIFEAGNSLKNINKIDIAIVPVVGVDGNLQRVGFGKGMYDRFFEKLKAKPYTLFVQTNLCYTKQNVCDHYDISCDLLLTPTDRIQNRNKRGNHVKRDTNRWHNRHN